MSRALLAVAVLAAVLTTGATGGQAAIRDLAPLPAAVPTRDHDHGDWFRQVCPSAALASSAASCGAQVVSDSSGAPLASLYPPTGAYGPAEFHTAYNLPVTAASGTPTIAIVDAYDDPSAESDLADYDSQYGLPACTTTNGCFRKVNQNGNATPLPHSNSGWGLEIALDVETAHEICQNCKILLVEANSAFLTDLGAAVNRAVVMGAGYVSNSYGGAEYSSETSDEVAYYKHPGVVITASTGDGGYGVEFPAASQYVTAVGGTSLHLNTDKTYLSESAWSGAGSGCSAYEPKPATQTATGCASRATADVSADADPNTGAAIEFGGAWYQVGGTSLSSPLIAAVYALAGSTNGAAPYSNPSALHDVTTGSNGNCGTSLCNAGVGYDGPTGLGTPNGLVAFGGTPPGPDFTLSGTPTIQTVTSGQTATYTVNVNPLNDFTGLVSLSASGQPAGATPTFSPSATSGASTLTVTTTAGATPGGSYTLTVTGTSSQLSHTTTLTLQVQAPAPSFTLGIAPVAPTVTAGSSTPFTVTVTGANGFNSPVSLQAGGLPGGWRASFSPGQTTSTSTMTITAPGNAHPGPVTFTVKGTSGSLSDTESVTLTVVVPSFTLAATPSSLTVPVGGSGSTTVTVTPANGFATTVSLSVQGLPGGVHASFNPGSTTGSSTLTISVDRNAHPGILAVTVKGSGSGVNATTTLTLTVH